MTAPHPARLGAPRCGHEHQVVRVTAGKDGWAWTRYLILGTGVRPSSVWDGWRAGDSSKKNLAYDFNLCPEQVDLAIQWCERRSAAAKRGKKP